MTPTAIALIAGAYLAGAVPCGLLIGLGHGVDIRRRGSGNIGATNVGRVLGRRWGHLCLVLDILKGFGPTLMASLVFGGGQSDTTSLLVVLAVALAAVLGHVFPIYLGFRGGKGVATTIGVAMGVWPHFTVAMTVALLAYAAGRLATGAVSVGSLALAAVFPAALAGYCALRGLPLATHWPLHAVAGLLALVIIVRHRDNIRRLLQGRELRVDTPSQPEQH